MSIDFYKYSDKGPRTENQDSLEVLTFNKSFIACVADGVGGANCGKLASEECLRFFVQKVKQSEFSLEEIILSSHHHLKDLQTKNIECKGMATTFTGCIIKDNQLNGVHVGDSRICILRGNGIKQLSENHTEVARLLRLGKLRQEDVDTYPRKHILESAVGINKLPLIQNFSFALMIGDRILITTDGVHDAISKLEFRDLSKKSKNINEFGNNIQILLKEKKLSDNTSFIVVSIE